MKFLFISLMCLSSFLSYAEIPTYVDCGKVGKVKVSSDKSIDVKLLDTKSGQFSPDGKIQLTNEVRDSIKTTLVPSRVENKASEVILKLKEAKELNVFVCISYPLSLSAIESGFPHEIGVGVELEDAKQNLEKNRSL